MNKTMDVMQKKEKEKKKEEEEEWEEEEEKKGERKEKNIQRIKKSSWKLKMLQEKFFKNSMQKF